MQKFDIYDLWNFLRLRQKNYQPKGCIYFGQNKEYDYRACVYITPILLPNFMDKKVKCRQLCKEGTWCGDIRRIKTQLKRDLLLDMQKQMKEGKHFTWKEFKRRVETIG